MKPKVLITGGAGYIGSKISYDLTDMGVGVVIVDNLSTGHINLINPKSIFFKLDILDTEKISKIIKKYNISKIYHMAASLSVEESMKNKEKYYLNNVEGTRSILNAGDKKINNLIFSSTCAVYGKTNKKFVSENSRIDPLSFYGKTKHLSELLIKESSKVNNFSYGILRYFNVAGSDEKLRTGCINQNGQLIKNLVSKFKLKDYTINIFGKNYSTIDGTCIRDYIHVSDLSKIHIDCMNYLSSKKKSVILNCGYGTGFSVLDIVKEFEKTSDKKFRKIFKKRRLGDVEQIIADTKKLKQVIKPKLKYNKNIKEILNSAIKWELKSK